MKTIPERVVRLSFLLRRCSAGAPARPPEPAMCTLVACADENDPKTMGQTPGRPAQPSISGGSACRTSPIELRKPGNPLR
jgi:hypothetical protein